MSLPLSFGKSYLLLGIDEFFQGILLNISLETESLLTPTSNPKTLKNSTSLCILYGKRIILIISN